MKVSEHASIFFKFTDGLRDIWLRLDTIYAIEATDDGCTICCNQGRRFECNEEASVLLKRMAETCQAF